MDWIQTIIKTALWTVFLSAVLVGLAALAFMYSGIYPIAASEPHLKPVRWALSTFQRNAVVRHAEGVEVPPLADPVLVRRGLVLYRELCAVCHGAPGIERAVIGRGLNPDAPRLTIRATEWTNAEVYWIVRNGLKMTGMPGFSTLASERDLWAIVAFVRRLPQLSQEEYEAMVAAVESDAVPPAPIDWVGTDDRGWARLRAEGDAERGETLIAALGCATCHIVPGVTKARGLVGPPLTAWAERHFIAGSVLNNPENLVRWIVDPDAIEPGTAMPDLAVTPEQALDIAAYLYTLGAMPDPDPLGGDL